jgi:cell division protein FtsB
VREQQQKIEHLEASVYELQEAMKELMKPKPKVNEKAKSKDN